MTQRALRRRARSERSAPTTFGEYLAGKPAGEASRIMYRTRLSWPLICRAKKGARVSLRAALLLSSATQLPPEVFCDHVPPDMRGKPQPATALDALSSAP